MSEAVSRGLTKKVSQEIEAAILPILERNGLKLTKFNAKYGDLYGLNISAVTVNLSEDGINLNSAEAISYSRFGHYGFVNGESLKLTAKLGTKFESRGRKFVFAGIRSRGKNKIVAKCENDGKEYVFADTVIPSINGSSK